MIGFKKIFFDTSPIIYYIEGNERYYDAVAEFFSDNDQSVFITTVITVGEYLTIPYRKDNKQYIEAFDILISGFNFDVIPIDERIARMAAKIRGKYAGFKLMDALQLAVATLNGCDAFITNDIQLRQYDGLNVVIIEELIT